MKNLNCLVGEIIIIYFYLSKINLMKKILILSSLLITFLLFPNKIHAQFWKKIQDKVEKKAEDVTDDILNGSDKSTQEEAEKKDEIPYVEKTFSYVPGKNTYFEDEFENDDFGAMPTYWKTNGVGSIVEISGIPGKWLELGQRSSFKLDTLLSMPENFTLEFDILTRSDKAEDLGAMNFGFSKDNSVRSWISDAYNDNSITSTELHFWNKDVTHSSSATDNRSTLDFPLDAYGNTVIHISIAVNNEQMRLYLDKSKLLDAKMFLNNPNKYFYISAPISYDHGAQIYIGNIKIAKN